MIEMTEESVVFQSESEAAFCADVSAQMRDAISAAAHEALRELLLKAVAE
jgi:hypothetical protein